MAFLQTLQMCFKNIISLYIKNVLSILFSSIIFVILFLFIVLTRDMTEKVSDDKIVIRQSSRKGIFSAVYSLEIPNVFTLEEYDNKVSQHYSPTFEFINLTWRFRTESDRKKGKNHLIVYLERINFKRLKRRIFYEIQLLDGNGVCHDDASVVHFEVRRNIRQLGTFQNMDLSHDKPNPLTLTVHLISVESDMEVLMRSKFWKFFTLKII